MALASAPAGAMPLVFGALDGVRDHAASSDIASCGPERNGERVCALKRTSFGGLSIVRATASLNGEGRVRALTVALDPSDFDTAVRLLRGRYGNPVRSDTGLVWRGFDDGAWMRATQEAGQAVVLLRYPANRPAAFGWQIDPQLLWAALGFTCLGLALGMIIYRPRRAPVPARPPEPEPISMRATLDRKVREGDLQF